MSFRCSHWTLLAIAAGACKTPPTPPTPPAPSASAASPLSAPAVALPLEQLSDGRFSASPPPAPSAAADAATEPKPPFSPTDAGQKTLPAQVRADLELPFLGTLGGERVVFRLTKTRMVLEARYFLEATGIDVLLKGRIRSDGSFVLKEKDSAAEWSGTLHGDQLTATRTLADSTLELLATRAPIASGPNWKPVYLATKRIPARCPDAGDQSAKFEYLEFVGAFSPELEAELNHELAPSRDAIDCGAARHPRTESRVLFNADGFVSIELRYVILYAPAFAAPSTWEQRYRTYSLVAQKALTTDEVFEHAFAGREAQNVFRKYVEAARSADPALVKTEAKHPVAIDLNDDSFAAEGTGVGFISGSNAVAWGGILIPYTELVKLEYLKPTSALAPLAFRGSKAQ